MTNLATQSKLSQGLVNDLKAGRRLEIKSMQDLYAIKEGLETGKILAKNIKLKAHDPELKKAIITEFSGLKLPTSGSKISVSVHITPSLIAPQNVSSRSGALNIRKLEWLFSAVSDVTKRGLSNVHAVIVGGSALAREHSANALQLLTRPNSPGTASNLTALKVSVLPDPKPFVVRSIPQMFDAFKKIISSEVLARDYKFKASALNTQDRIVADKSLSLFSELILKPLALGTIGLKEAKLKTEQLYIRVVGQQFSAFTLEDRSRVLAGETLQIRSREQLVGLKSMLANEGHTLKNLRFNLSAGLPSGVGAELGGLLRDFSEKRKMTLRVNADRLDSAGMDRIAETVAICSSSETKPIKPIVVGQPKATRATHEAIARKIAYS